MPLTYKYMTTIFLILFFSAEVLSQTPRVLIVGDSWAQQQRDDQAHQIVFDANGYSSISAVGENTAISGSTAAEWVAPQRLQAIADALSANPTIDTVQLTVGGNDFLDAWTSDISAADEMALQQQISADIQTIIDFILSQDIEIEVILSFYDYPNFVDTIDGFVAVCRNLHNDLNQPTPFQLNDAARVFEEAYASLATSNPRVSHVSHAGLMQNTYGFPDDNIQPGDILPPGDLNLPSPVESMRITFSVTDCFHLRPEGYDVLIQNLVDNYFADRFDTIFNSHAE